MKLADHGSRAHTSGEVHGMRRLVADLSAGTERLPIPCFSDRDKDEELPTDFIYVRDCVVPADLPVLSDAAGCDERCLQNAEQCCGSCPCSGPAKTAEGEASSHAAFECGPACACSPTACRNRASQHGLAVCCEVRKTSKGWGVFAAEPIEPGAFVCVYAGELLGNREADARLLTYDSAAREQPGNALLIVREVLPSGQAALRLNIDATRQRNVAAWINHSCGGGNLRLEVVRRRGEFLPAVGLFSRRRVLAGEELLFQYGPPNAGRQGGRRCLCGAPQCLGFLPSEV